MRDFPFLFHLISQIFPAEVHPLCLREPLAMILKYATKIPKKQLCLVVNENLLDGVCVCREWQADWNSSKVERTGIL